MRFFRNIMITLFLVMGSFTLVGCGSGETSYSLDDLQSFIDETQDSNSTKVSVESVMLSVKDTYAIDKNSYAIQIDLDLDDDVEFHLDNIGEFEIVDGKLQPTDISTMPLGRTTIVIVIEDSKGNSVKKNVVIIIVDDLNKVVPTILTSTFDINENSTDGLPIKISLIGNGKLDNVSFAGGIDDDLFILSKDGVLTLKSTIDYEDSSISHTLSIKVQAFDDLGNQSDITDITINVIDIDEGYTFTSAKSFDALNSATTVATLVAVKNDVSIPEATYSFEVANSELSIDSSTGIITFSVATPTVQTHTINVIAQNNFNGSYTVQPIIINILEDFSKIRPVIITTSLTTDENLIENMIVNIQTDGTGVVTNYYISGTDSSSFLFNDGKVSFISAPDYEAKSSYSIMLQVEDNFGNISDEKVVVIMINNLGPTNLKISTVSNSIESSFYYGAKVNDTTLKAEEKRTDERNYNVEFTADGLTGLKYTITNNSMFDSMNENAAKILTVPADANHGNYGFTIKVCDMNSECLSQSMTATIY